MADTCFCRRCGYEQPAPEPILPFKHAVTIVCPKCCSLIVREMGEMTGPDERADPDDWGGSDIWR